jgi:hypothetical protein
LKEHSAGGLTMELHDEDDSIISLSVDFG